MNESYLKLFCPDQNSSGQLNTNRIIGTEIVTTEPIERPMTSTMSRRVSFNKEIDVRVFMKNSKNTKLIESYLQPLTATPIPCEINNNNDLFIANRSIATSSSAYKQSNGKLIIFLVSFYDPT